MSRKTVLSLLVLIGIFIYGKSLPQQVGQVKTASNSKEAGVTPSPTAEPTPTETPRPTPAPSPTPTTRPTSGVQLQQSITTSAFMYPNARQERFEDEKIKLETTDNPDAVTDWYKNKIKSFSMSAKSFVQTNTNGNVLNKLVGDNGEIEVRIEITKKANDSVTKISVAVKTS